jgi:hypothetical protein
MKVFLFEDSGDILDGLTTSGMNLKSSLSRLGGLLVCP